jgi:hypothetical protein
VVNEESVVTRSQSSEQNPSQAQARLLVQPSMEGGFGGSISMNFSSHVGIAFFIELTNEVGKQLLPTRCPCPKNTASLFHLW